MDATSLRAELASESGVTCLHVEHSCTHQPTLDITSVLTPKQASPSQAMSLLATTPNHLKYLWPTTKERGGKFSEKAKPVKQQKNLHLKCPYCYIVIQKECEVSCSEKTWKTKRHLSNTPP